MVKMDYIDYFDVWGNPDDGFEVNNLCRLFEGIRFRNPTPRALVGFLKRKGYFKQSVKLSDLEIRDSGNGFIEIDQADNGCPIGRFEEIR